MDDACRSSRANFAPTAQEAATVSQFLAANGLSVVEVGAKNMFVRARGTVANVNKAFHVQLNNFELNGKTYYANTSAPQVDGPAGALTAAVAGLHDLQYTHPYVQQMSTPTPHTGSPAAARTTSVTPPPISSQCFSGVEKETFNNDGSYPVVTVHGNGYAANAGPGGCGYTPPEIQAAYNLTGLYNEGLDGTGQTIVIIDWCGSPTITADANTFSAAYGLPALTPGVNFNILNSSTPPTCAAPDPEINIDVEWAHAIAPGATIDLVDSAERQLCGRRHRRVLRDHQRPGEGHLGKLRQRGTLHRSCRPADGEPPQRNGGRMGHFRQFLERR